MEQANREYQHAAWRRLTAGCLVAGLALTAACSSSPENPVNPEPQQLMPRPAPPSAEYFLDSSNPYYGKVDAVLQQTGAPVARANLIRLKQTPIAKWLNQPEGKTDQYTIDVVAKTLADSQAAGSVAMFVPYHIPNRDLGGESGGGATSGAEYTAWISAISETIDNRPALIILEPDALPGVLTMPAAARNERISLLRQALVTFQENNENTAVYLDAGHSKWLTPPEAAGLLRQIDPEGNLVHGISLNVSNQRPESEIRGYAEQIQQVLGRSLYIMADNAENGAHNTADLLDWCNVAGEKMGHLDDTLFDPDKQFETSFIKGLGESDGICGTETGPDAVAGNFVPRLLLRQVS